MAPTNAFRLRWKGAVTGPFPLARVQELLRAGEISLLHNIEVDGGIGPSTIEGAAAAGANVLIAGTALFRYTEGLEFAVKDLRAKATAARNAK